MKSDPEIGGILGMRQLAKSSIMFLLFAMSVMLLPVVGTAASFANFNTGPYVDKVVYLEIHSENQRVAALLNNEIDMIGQSILPESLPALEADSNIEVVRTPRNGYGHLTINCAKYPYNITAFRRALAFALDKEQIASEVWEGEAIPQDCVIPAINPWSYESHLTDTYYAAQPSIGNQLLDDAGFLDVDADGFREAPDGSGFVVLVELPATSQVLLDCGYAVGDALSSLSIAADIRPSDFNEYLARVNFHGDFDIALYGFSFTGFEPNFLETQYGSDYYMVDYCNTVNFQNSTFDGWIPQLLYGITYEDVLEAVNEMQRILWYEQPRIMLYNNYNIGAYRTDVFEGHVESAIDGIAGPWTNLKVHRNTGSPYGGTFRVSLGGTPESYNHMVASSAYSAQVLNNMENSLMKPGPDGTLVPWLAESYLIETHEDNSNVPEGHMRFYFDLVTNATWSDDTPVTAEDVAFTLNYYKDGIIYGNPTNLHLDEMTLAFAPTTYSLVVEMDTVSFWHLKTVAHNTILPKHIFESVGVENWYAWDPVYGSDPYVTSGPFYPGEVIASEFHELLCNPDFFFCTRGGFVADEVEYAEGSIGNTIEWDVTSTTPLYYEVYRDGSLIGTEPWDGSPIEYNVDGLSLGDYNYTIRAYYGSGVYYSYTAWVTVYDGTPPTIYESSDLTLYEGRPSSVVNWNPYDLHPASYIILINGSIEQSGLWNSSVESISFSMSAFEVGVYNLTLIVIDIGSNSAYDSLLVTIVPYVPGTTTTPTTSTTTTTTTTTTDVNNADLLLLAIAGTGAAVVVLLAGLALIRRRP
ncbi:MAG: hypothetical protein EAX95_12795 [Candidatus Thorarchaeota archaeon]|nr:hypothetical protein [Candidatus Thorarchaeota archaeon]